MMKSKICPYKDHCHDAGCCEECDHGKSYERLSMRIKRLKSKNEALMQENEQQRKRLETLLHPQF